MHDIEMELGPRFELSQHIFNMDKLCKTQAQWEGDNMENNGYEQHGGISEQQRAKLKIIEENWIQYSS